MSIYQFIEQANAMRAGQTSQSIRFASLGCPRSYRGMKAHSHIHRKLEDAYSGLWGFAIKHPDSKRTRKSRQRAKDMRAIRQQIQISIVSN
jgi:hypothetical protein